MFLLFLLGHSHLSKPQSVFLLLSLQLFLHPHSLYSHLPIVDLGNRRQLMRFFRIKVFQGRRLFFILFVQYSDHLLFCLYLSLNLHQLLVFFRSGEEIFIIDICCSPEHDFFMRVAEEITHSKGPEEEIILVVVKQLVFGFIHIIVQQFQYKIMAREVVFRCIQIMFYLLNQMQNIGDHSDNDAAYPPSNDLLGLDNDRYVPLFEKNNSNSLDRNQSNDSDRNADFNDLCNNKFQTNNNQLLNEVNLLEQINDNAQKQTEFSSIEKVLIQRDDLEAYEKILKNIYLQFELIGSERSVRLIGRIMQVESRSKSQSEFFIRALVFVVKVLGRLKDVGSLSKYRPLLGQLLNYRNSIYSIQLTEDELELLKYYITQFQNSNEESHQMVNQDAQMDFEEAFFFIKQEQLHFRTDHLETMASIVNDHFDNQTTSQHLNTLKPLFSFIYEMACECCYRNSATSPELGVFLISKAPNPQLEQYYLKRFQESIYIADFSSLDKKYIEDYIAEITPIASADIENAKRYIFRPIHWLLQENDQIEKKISGFKMLSTLIEHAKNNALFKTFLIDWLNHQHILQTFLRESTNHRILQNTGSILHFLYENNNVSQQFLESLIVSSLTSEDMGKIMQPMMVWLTFQDVELALTIFESNKHKEAPNLGQSLSNLIQNKTIESVLAKKRKNIILQDNSFHHEREMVMNKLVLPQFEEEEPENQNHYPVSSIISRILRLLIELANYNLQIYIPILIKLLNAYISIFKAEFEEESMSLIKRFEPVGIWILEQCLKCETGKNQYINKLLNEGIYECVLATLAKNRYTKIIAEKILQVIILFSKTHKPLERNSTEFLWKVLGLTGRDEKEREQFFVFLKEIVRYEGAIHQQSVNYIYFEILMSLNAEWFSLRIYDCLEMLFYRLNEDCKLISFEKDHYNVHDCQLIGLDKFWYIYFNCSSQPILKKCKDVIFKLIKHSGQKQQDLYRQSIKNLHNYINAALSLEPQMHSKQQILLNRIFDIAEKLQFQRDSVDQNVKPVIISLKIVDLCPDSYKKTNSFDFNDTFTLSEVKRYIGENLNPPRRTKELELLNKGKILVGENQTLKQLKICNNETITVNIVLQQRQVRPLDSKHEYLPLIKSVFQDQYETDFLEFIITKYEGYKYEAIVDDMFEEAKIVNLKQEYDRKKQQSQEIIKNPKRFAQMLVESKEDIMLLMKCLVNNYNKKKAWLFIKQLPLNQYYLEMAGERMESGDWEGLFLQKGMEEEIYLVYLIYKMIKSKQKDGSLILQAKGFKRYLVEWLMQIIKDKGQNLDNYEIILQLLLLSANSNLFSTIDSLLNKSQPHQSLHDQLLQLPSFITHQQPILSQKQAQTLINFLAHNHLPQKLALHIIKLYLQQACCQHQSGWYSILGNNNLVNLVLRYGESMLLAIVGSAWVGVNGNNLSALSFLMLKQYQDRSYKNNCLHVASLFGCINQLIAKSPLHQHQHQTILYAQTLLYFKHNVQILIEKEIVGYLNLLLTLTNRHLKMEGNVQPIPPMLELTSWLYASYLFGLSSPPSYKNKEIRKASYDLVYTLCAYPSINQAIVQSINYIMGGFKGSLVEEGQFRTAQFIGIRNLGATCYINSLLQQLYHTKFAKYLLQEEAEGDTKLLELKKIFANLYMGQKSLVDPTKYVETVKINGQNIRPIVQQDANEYFASLMHEIQSSSGNIAINSTISGTICHEIKGLEQGAQTKINEEPFLTIMLEIKYKRHFFEALEAPNKIHYLEGDNMYYSDVLKKKIRATSRMYLNKLPNLLIFTLKRFSWNHQTISRSKINDYFEFPTKLNLYEYTNQAQTENLHYFDYQLCGILIHSGSAESGHYYSYIKVRDKWMQFNDRKVSEWDISNLKHECFGGISDDKNRNAYMLFYERVNSQSHGTFLHELPSSNSILQQVRQQNQNFIKNRLVYDCNYIDFLKKLGRRNENGCLLQIIDRLSYGRVEKDNNSLI